LASNFGHGPETHTHTLTHTRLYVHKCNKCAKGVSVRAFVHARELAAHELVKRIDLLGIGHAGRGVVSAVRVAQSVLYLDSI
jgi:hypothetical protein